MMANLSVPMRDVYKRQSPLLSNIVLNELDWWIVSQWEEMPTQRNYVHRIYAKDVYKRQPIIRLPKSHITEYSPPACQVTENIGADICRR